MRLLSYIKAIHRFHYFRYVVNLRRLWIEDSQKKCRNWFIEDIRKRKR